MASRPYYAPPVASRIALLLTLCLLPLPARAWSKLAHELIAYLAEDELTPEAKAGIRRLLHGRHISDGDVASWADDLAHRLPESAKWHYVNIPMGAGKYVASRDCPNNDCVVAKIEEYRKTLADQWADAPVRADALRFIVHFVADAQQPLHCLDDNDRGGNDVVVELKGHAGTLTLHQVWDGTLLEDDIGRRTLSIYKRQLLTDVTPGLRRKFSEGSLEEWINQCHSDGEIIYDALKLKGGPERLRLPESYVAQQSGVLEIDMERAAVRLAIVLNEALKNESLEGATPASTKSHHHKHHH